MGERPSEQRLCPQRQQQATERKRLSAGERREQSHCSLPSRTDMEMRQGGREQASFSCSPGSHAHLSGVLIVMAMLKGREAVSLADCQHVSLAWNSCTCLWPEFWVLVSSINFTR